MAFDNIGDVVMATSVVGTLRKIFPRARLGFWVKEYAEGVVQDNPDITWVHVSDPFWDSAPGRAKGSFIQFVRSMADVRRVGYDVALVLNAEWRRSLVAAFLRIPVRAGLAQKKSRWFLTHTAKNTWVPRHFTQDHHAVLESWTGRTNSENSLPIVHTNPAADRWADQWVQDRGWSSSPLIICHPFSGDPEKNWPLKYWAEMISTLGRERSDLRFIIFSGPWEPPATALVRALSESRVINISGTTLAQVKSLLRRSTLFIGNDSGPAHLAAASGIPLIALFGKADPGRTGPRGKGKFVFLREATLSGIPVKSVIEAAQSLLKG